MKTKIKTKLTKFSIITITSLVMVLGANQLSAYLINEASNFGRYLGRSGNLYSIVNYGHVIPTYSLNVPKAKAEEPELTMREYVQLEVHRAGLDWKEVDKIIECESNWNPDNHAVNWGNKAGVDRGLWQISSLYHKEVSNQCAYDYKCSTKEAIRIYKEWGGWGAWSCSRLVL